MASFWYDNAKLLLAKGDLDFDTVALDVKLMMTNTTCDTEKDKVTFAGFSTADEYDGAGYTKKSTLGQSVAVDNPNNRAEITCANFTFGATVAAGTRQAQGMLVLVHVNGTTTDIPVAWIDTGGFPFTGNGGAVNVTVNAEGLLQVT